MPVQAAAFSPVGRTARRLALVALATLLAAGAAGAQ